MSDPTTTPPVDLDTLYDNLGHDPELRRLEEAVTAVQTELDRALAKADPELIRLVRQLEQHESAAYRTAVQEAWRIGYSQGRSAIESGGQ